MPMQKSQQSQQQQFAYGQYDSFRSHSPCESVNSFSYDEDPGLISESESVQGDVRRFGVKPRASALPVVRTPSKTMERPLGVVFLQFRSETKRAVLPNEITTVDTVRALFVRAFQNHLSMEYLDSPRVSIYILDSNRDMFYELEDLSDIRDRSVLRIQEAETSECVAGPPPRIVQKPILYCQSSQDTDQSYFSEPEYDSDCQRKHVHKIKGPKGPHPSYYQMVQPITSDPIPMSSGRGYSNYNPSMQIAPNGEVVRSFSPSLESSHQITQREQASQKYVKAYLNAPQYLSMSGSVSPHNSTPSPRPPIPVRPSAARPSSPMYYNQPTSDRRDYCQSSKSFSGDGYRDHSPVAQFQQPMMQNTCPPSASQYPVTSQLVGSVPPSLHQGFSFAEPAPSMDPNRMEQMERQLANLTGLLQSALSVQPRSGMQNPLPNDQEEFESEEHFNLSKADKTVSFDKKITYNDDPRKPILMATSRQVSFEGPDQRPVKSAIKIATMPTRLSGPGMLSPTEVSGRLRVLQKRTRDLKMDLRSLRKLSVYHTGVIKKEFQEFVENMRTVLTNVNEDSLIKKDDLVKEEATYKSKVDGLESELSDLETTVEDVRNNVINKRLRVTMNEVERLATLLSLSSKNVADVKCVFDTHQEKFAQALEKDLERISREKRFLTEEPDRVDNLIRRCKKLTGTLLTLKRLASVQEQRHLNFPDGQDSDFSHPAAPNAVLKGDASARGGKGRQYWQSETDARTRAQNTLDDLLNQLKDISTDNDETPCSSPKLPQKGDQRHPPPPPPRGAKFQPERTSSPTPSLTMPRRVVMTGIRVLPTSVPPRSPGAREPLSSTSSSTESIDSQKGASLPSRRPSVRDSERKRNREPEIYDFGKEPTHNSRPVLAVEPKQVKAIDDKPWAETDIL